jgi:PAS domain S-box-containing protein
MWGVAFALALVAAPAWAQSTVLRVGLHDSSPVGYRDENGQARGFGVEVIEHIASLEGWTLEYKYGSWEECYDRLRNRELDLLFPMVYSPQRAEFFDFTTQALMSSWGRVFVRRGVQVQDVTDLAGLSVAVVRGDYFNDQFRSLARGVDCNVREFPTKSDVLNALQEGTCEAAAIEGKAGYSRIVDGGLEATPIFYSRVKPLVAVPKGTHADVLAALDARLGALIANRGSLYYKAYARWFESGLPTRAPTWLLPAIVVALSSVLGLIALSLIMRKRVGRATQALSRRNAELAQEIIERQKVEADLRLNQKRLRLITDALPVLIAYIDRDLRYRFCNATHRSWLEMAPADLLGRSMEDVVGATVFARLRGYVDQVLSGESVTYDTILENEFTGTRSVSVNYVPNIATDGEVIGFYSMISDITARLEAQAEQRRLQEQLQHAQKIDALGQLAGGVAHDVNNLMTVIAAHASLLRPKLARESLLHDSLKSIDDAVRHASGVTRSLLTFSRRLPTDKRPVDLGSAMETITRMLHRTMPATIELSVQIQCEVQPWVQADDAQLQQVVLNLALNARDAMPGGGQLVVSVSAPPQDHIGICPPGIDGPAVRLSVQDSGCGISAHIQNQMFEPFFSTKPPAERSGLGLAIVHGIVVEHAGQIAVHSAPGSGSVFVLDLPRIPVPHDADGAAAPIDPPCGSGERVLLAEDHDQIREVLASYLTGQGYVVDQVADGMELAEHHARHAEEVRLLVLDVDLPKRSGAHFLEELRGTGNRTPAILMTANGAAQTRGQSDPSTRVLSKPFQLPDLGELAHAALTDAMENGA